jgi:hypothetical protein
MAKRSLMRELNWLNGNPRLDELVERYPAAWEDASRELVFAAKTGRTQKLNEYAAKAKATAQTWASRIRKSRNNPEVIESALPHVVRSRMSLLALEKCYLARAAGKVSGKVRFNILNGYIIQKLLFSCHLIRKPASLRWFKFWWPLLTQRRLLMPLVQEKGIYCFYSRELITELSALIGDRSTLEIAAGDGTLSRFLRDKGCRITATDDLSWKHAIDYPESVEHCKAKQALAHYKPQAVICSWPPPGNNFERQVFFTKSVELYIVIGSRYDFVTGNWDAYKEQDKFEWALDERLSRLVIPPESGNAVLVFKKKLVKS